MARHYPEPISYLPAPPLRPPSVTGTLVNRVALAFVVATIAVTKKRIAALVDERRRYRAEGRTLLAHRVDDKIAVREAQLARLTDEAELIREVLR